MSKVPVAFTLNGSAQHEFVGSGSTLLWVLREKLGFTGTKNGCSHGSCGACTILMDNKAVYACSVLAIEAQGKQIVTTDGLAPQGQLHPVSAAFVDNDAQQCGFCTPGFVMATKAFVDKHPSATPDEIAKGLGGNFCRCGTYAGIKSAVAQLSKGGPQQKGGA